jgi:streptogramin lyase
MSDVRSMLRWFLPLLPVLVALAAVVALALAAEESGRTFPLAQGGASYEVTADAHGDLWVSDYGASQIWGIDPVTGVYTAVHVSPHQPASAQIGPDGALWWRDVSAGGSNDLARWMPGETAATVWTLDGDGFGFGLTFDDAGRVWASDNYSPTVYRLEPDIGRLCTYTLPYGASDYVLYSQSELWLGDAWEGLIVRLDPANGETTAWFIEDVDEVTPEPRGLVAGEQGEIWWTDPALNQIGRLAPQTNTITVYEVPTATITSTPSVGPRLRHTSDRQPLSPSQFSFSAPEMLVLLDGLVWFSDSVANRFGSLNPAVAPGQSSVASSTDYPAVLPQCQDDPPVASLAVTVITGQQGVWLAQQYAVQMDSDGWTIYHGLPGGSPYGVAVARGGVYLTDRANNVMITLQEFPEQDLQELYLPLIIR